ncbi:MAG: N-acetylmuramoyl-L-alanine amidase [Clostridia bacterium]|nr:N-acetylmuramoyl-L-alanine amidase [Clostridia bacterium]
MKIIASQKIKIKTTLFASLIFIFSVIAIGTRYVYVKSAMDVLNSSVACTVVIDAGHGGVDSGTSAADGTPEKEINLQIAHKLNDILTSFGIETVMTRVEDISIHDDTAKTIRQKKVSDIKNRLSIINNTDNAIYVSIHQNHYSDSKYSGTQVFYSKNNPDSEVFANKIRGSVVSILQKDNTREIKQSGKEIYLLNNAQVPAVMVECGFMSNIKETELLKNSDYQQKMAFVIALGICDYINSSKDV